MIVGPDDVIAAAPGLTEQQAGELSMEIHGILGRVAPCLLVEDLDPGTRAEARGILLRAIKARLQVAPGLASEGAGSFSATYLTDGLGNGALSRADVDALKALCGATAPGSVPQGSYPAPSNYEALFAKPRRLL